MPEHDTEAEMQPLTPQMMARLSHKAQMKKYGAAYSDEMRRRRMVAESKKIKKIPRG